MNTIKVYLSTSGRVADLRKDFPLYCGQFQDTLLKIFVPTAILAPDFEIQHFIGSTSGTIEPVNFLIPQENLQTDLTNFCVEQSNRQPVKGDVIFYTYTTGNKYYRALYTDSSLEGNEMPEMWVFTEVPYFSFGNFAGTSVKVGVIATETNGLQYKSKSYYCRYIRTITSSHDGVEYAQYERKMPREFTAVIGSGQAARTVVINVVNSALEKEETADYLFKIKDAKVENIVTSQTVNLDVLPSTQLDMDEPIDTTAQEELWTAINDITAELSNKQDITPEAGSLETDATTIVGAINELENLKQDKVDTTIDYKSQTTVVGAINKLAQDKQEVEPKIVVDGQEVSPLSTDAETIVGAINEVDEHADSANAQAAENKEDISGMKSRMTSVEGVADAANNRSIDNASDIADLKPRMTAVESVASAANARSIQNASDIAALQAIVGTGEVPIGTKTINYDPTLPQNASRLASDLNDFVQANVGRAPKRNDSVIVVYEITGQTDRNFKYIYTESGWQGYEIPPMELASNGTAGLVSGTYNVGSSNNTIVNIVGGEIQNIYVKDGSTYRDIQDFLLANKLSISNIIDGTTVVKEAESATKDSNGDNIATKFAGIIDGSTKVGAAAGADSAEVATKDSAGNNIANSFAALVSGATKVGAAANADAADVATKDSAGNNIATQFSNIVSGTTQVGAAAYAAEALKATQDALGNNIVNTYLTQTNGATKQYVQDYSLPKEFNNCLYMYIGYWDRALKEEPYLGSAVVQRVWSTIGEHELLPDLTYTLDGVKFQLSRKNSFSARIFLRGWGAATTAQFKMNVYAKKAGENPILLVADLLPPQEMPSTITAIDFGAQFTALGDTILNLESGDEIIINASVIYDVSGETTTDVSSSEIYPSRFNLNTTAQIIQYGDIGEMRVISATPTVETLTFGSSLLPVTNSTVVLTITDETVIRSLERNRTVQFSLKFDTTGLTIPSNALTVIRYVLNNEAKYLSVKARANSKVLVSAGVRFDSFLYCKYKNAYGGDTTQYQALITLENGVNADGIPVDDQNNYTALPYVNMCAIVETPNIVNNFTTLWTLTANSWDNGEIDRIVIPIGGIGDHDAVFLTPSTVQDREKAANSGLFAFPNKVTVNGIDYWRFTCVNTPTEDIYLNVYVIKGMVGAQTTLFLCGVYPTPSSPVIQNQVTDENGNPVTDENGNPVTAE